MLYTCTVKYHSFFPQVSISYVSWDSNLNYCMVVQLTQQFSFVSINAFVDYCMHLFIVF